MKAKGKKRDVKSLFQSKSSLKKQAVKMSAKQDESDIKSTGARNDYLLSLVTANAHQDRYFHYDLQSTVRDMEGGIYDKLSASLSTFARTELLTCAALQSSLARVQDEAEHISREYNYRCYLKKFTCLGDHVQYAFEAVEGDTITTITPSEHDAGYSLNYEARATANKLNQAVKTIRAYRKRIKACHVHKSKGLKQEPNDPNGPNLDDKIEELEAAIRSAETEKSKCEARLNKLREGAVPVDEYLDAASLAILETENKEQQQQEWGTASSNGTTSQMDTPQTEEAAGTTMERQVSSNNAAPRENGEWDGGFEEEDDDDEGGGGQWGEVASQAAAKAKQRAQAADDGWANAAEWGTEETATYGDEDDNEEGAPAASGERQCLAPEDIDPNAAIWRAVVLFTFEANNEDELDVVENEEVDILVRECDEEGWLMGRTKAGRRGYVPYNYVEVYECLAEDDQQQGEEKRPLVNRTNSSRQGAPPPS